MAGTTKDQTSLVEPVDFLDRIDRVFDEWMRMLPFRRPLGVAQGWASSSMIQVDEYHKDGSLIIRAEIAGIDPEKDVELTVTNGVLHIEADRRHEETTEDRGYVRKEIRRGSFTRDIPLPDGVADTDITASYENGILEVKVPTPQPGPATKIAVTKR